MPQAKHRNNFFAKFDRRLWWIVGLAAIIIFWRISHVDMLGDDAHYSARAVGLVDFMFANPEYQSTPLQWYSQLPWWSHLSFHDHPILLFFISYFFLSVNESIFFAKLPFALMTLASLVFMYQWIVIATKKESLGLLATILLTLNAQFIWAGRVSYLEGGVIFFTLLAILTFWKFMDERRFWLVFGLCFGLALLSKFITFFLIPAFILTIFFTDRSLFRKRELYLSFGLAFLVNTPTIIYNIFMYFSTGHFALQFARLFHQTSPWHLEGVRTGSFLTAFVGLFQNLGGVISWLYLACSLLALGIMFFERTRLNIFLVSSFIFLVIQHIFIGNGGNVLAIFTICFAPLLAVAINYIWSKVSVAKIPRTIFYVFATTGSLYAFFFVVNSHVFFRHIGSVGYGHSSLSSENRGVYQLDQYLSKLIATNGPWDSVDIYYVVKRVDPRLHKYITTLTSQERKEQAAHSRVILFDNSINWFARVWLFERRRFYDNIPFVGIQEQKLLDQLKIYHMYFIRATSAAPLDHVDDQGSFEVEKLFLAANVQPTLIYRDDGQVAFRVYEADTSVLFKKK